MPLKPGKRQLKSEQNKARIYQSAMKLFHEYGYQNVAIEDIVKASGTSVGSFYHYFKSKDALVILFLETYFQSSFNEYEERVLNDSLDSEVPILSQLCDFLIFSIGLPHEGGEEFLRAATMYMLREESGQVAFHYMLDPERPFARVCRKLLQEGQRRGEIRTDKTPDELLELISIFSNGIDQMCYMSRKEIAVKTVYSGAIEDFVHRMLSA